MSGDIHAVLRGIPDLICFWDFQEGPGEVRVAKGPHPYRLIEMAGPVRRADDGALGPYSALLDEGQWFCAPRATCPELNIYGKDAQVTVAAWIKRHRTAPNQCEAVAGMWDETRSKRQYCLFLNLRIWESQDQVCGHVSSVGGPTPGHRYCMDASIGQTPVPFGVWQFAAFTYDGAFAKSYLNGVLDERPGRNPYPYEGGIFDGGESGSDFSVGGVSRSGEMGNWFSGQLGGLAVWRRALSPIEIGRLYEKTRPATTTSS